MFFKKKNEWKRGEKVIARRFLDSIGSRCNITNDILFNRRQNSLSINDAIWSLCNEYVLENMKSNNINNIIALYFQMEYLLVSEGKKANYIVKKRLLYTLLDYKQQGCNLAIIVVPLEESCNACKALDGIEFDIDEAIKKQPLPPLNCTCLRCGCTY
jgi:hypothetical protein